MSIFRGCDGGSRPHALHAVDDDPLAGLQSAGNDPQAALQLAERDGPVVDLVLAVDHKHVLLSLIVADGPLGDHQRLVRLAAPAAAHGRTSRAGAAARP